MEIINNTNNGLQMTVQMASGDQLSTLEPNSSRSFSSSDLPPNSTSVQLTPLAVYGVIGSTPSWYYTNINDDQCLTFTVEVT
jgi:hypothetical protein